MVSEVNDGKEGIVGKFFEILVGCIAGQKTNSISVKPHRNEVSNQSGIL